MVDKSLIVFICLFVLFLVLTTFLKRSLTKFNSQLHTEFTKNEEAINHLFEFAYDIHFNPPPDNIIVDNPYECTPTDLRPCDINDPFSCAGCKSLISSCVHIDKDTKYIDADGNETTIAKNTNENDGYCLTQLNHSQACNPYHGELVMVQAGPKSREMMLYCDCKNPGFIGKTHLNGACNEVFICDGDIDDINQPLEKISCICKDYMVPQLSNHIPTCIAPMVKDYKGYEDENFYHGVETVDRDRFVGNISDIGNFPGSQIKNPCRYCLVTGNYVGNGTMVRTEDGGWQCGLLNSQRRGLPIRRDPKYRILKGKAGPDAVIDVRVVKLYLHGYVYENVYGQKTAVLETAENIDILKYMNVKTDKKYAFIDLGGHQLVFPGSFGEMDIHMYPAIVCTGIEVPVLWVDDFQYKCDFSNNIPTDRNPAGHLAYTSIYQQHPRIAFETAPACPPKHHSFLTGWTFKKWRFFEGYNSIHYRRVVNGLQKYEIKQGVIQSQKIKYMISVIDLKEEESAHYGAPNWSIYMEWYATLIIKDVP
ncbi:PIF-1 [Homarus gammarus nudivirus]|uniref:PIF-1 n=1 Tax=Homarus gammarus nudivirus TaxID=2509616 RepID=A0A411HB89_9VIRU|nr:PIF-1 [Homarus gammarus nudivirus]QBB28633.1 PIF-1 [Homarus gammarus nudivirus]